MATYYYLNTFALNRKAVLKCVLLSFGKQLFLVLIFSAWAKSILSQLGKFFVTGSFGVIYVYAAELYPTVLRSTGIGMTSVMLGLDQSWPLWWEENWYSFINRLER